MIITSFKIQNRRDTNKVTFDLERQWATATSTTFGLRQSCLISVMRKIKRVVEHCCLICLIIMWANFNIYLLHGPAKCSIHCVSINGHPFYFCDYSVCDAGKRRFRARVRCNTEFETMSSWARRFFKPEMCAAAAAPPPTACRRRAGAVFVTCSRHVVHQLYVARFL